MLSLAAASTADAQRGGRGGRGALPVGGRGAPPVQQDPLEILRNAQAAEDATPEQLEQFDLAVLATFVDVISQGLQPAPEQALSVEWVAEDSLRAGPGQTYVPFTLTINGAAIESSDIVLYVRAVDKVAPPPPDGEAPVYAWDNIRFTTLAASGQLMPRMVLDPGEYDVFVAAKRRSTPGDMAPPFGLVRHDLSVPAYDADVLSTSTLIRFEDFDQLPAPPTDEQLDANPYIVGNNRFERKHSTEYSPAADISFFFFIYGPETDDNGMPDLLVESVINGGERPVAMTPVEYTAENLPEGFPVEDGIFYFSAAPLASFAPGEYQLEVTVTDRAADETVVHDVSFTVR